MWDEKSQVGVVRARCREVVVSWTMASLFKHLARSPRTLWDAGPGGESRGFYMAPIPSTCGNHNGPASRRAERDGMPRLATVPRGRTPSDGEGSTATALHI